MDKKQETHKAETTRHFYSCMQLATNLTVNNVFDNATKQYIDENLDLLSRNIGYFASHYDKLESKYKNSADIEFGNMANMFMNLDYLPNAKKEVKALLSSLVARIKGEHISSPIKVFKININYDSDNPDQKRKVEKIKYDFDIFIHDVSKKEHYIYVSRDREEETALLSDRISQEFNNGVNISIEEIDIDVLNNLENKITNQKI